LMFFLRSYLNLNKSILSSTEFESIMELLVNVHQRSHQPFF
jgi:hypothetical protein